MLTDCKIRGDEPHAKAIAMARMARKETERPHFLMTDLLPRWTSGKLLGLPADYISNIIAQAVAGKSRRFTQNPTTKDDECNGDFSTRKLRPLTTPDGHRWGLHNLRHSLSNWLVNKPRKTRRLCRESWGTRGFRPRSTCI